MQKPSCGWIFVRCVSLVSPANTFAFSWISWELNPDFNSSFLFLKQLLEKLLFIYFPLTSVYIDQLLPGQQVKEAFSLKLQTQSNLIFNNKIKWNFTSECSKITLNIYFFLFIIKHTPTNYTKIIRTKAKPYCSSQKVK